MPHLSSDLINPDGWSLTGFWKSYGFVDEINLFGAPYDWRYAPDNLQGYFEQLRQLVEQASHLNDNRTVTLFAVGNGAMVTLAFFDYIQEHYGVQWVQQYLCAFYADSGAYAGAIAMIPLITQGMDYESIPPESPLRYELHHMEITWPALYWNLPKTGPGVDTYNDSIPLASDGTRNYTASQLGDFWDKVFTNTRPRDIWERVRNITSQSFNAPPVNTTLIQSLPAGTPVSKQRYEPVFIDCTHFLPIHFHVLNLDILPVLQYPWRR